MIGPPTVAAAADPYRDPLGLLPAWALEGGTPGDPLAGLLPQDPLAGLLPEVPVPGAPGLPKAGAGPTPQPGPKAPADLTIPAPPQAPDCQCAPGTVNVGTGALQLSTTDLRLLGIGLPITLGRRYSSSKAEQDGPFGPGWSLELDGRLQMYVGFHLTEERGDGTRTTFRFTDGSGGAYVDSYDGDSLIHTDLAQGSYAPDNAPGYLLQREASDRYVITRPDGTVAVYHGYYAAWRTSQDPLAGRLTQLTDRNGNALNFRYDGSGQLSRVADAHGRFLAFRWNGGRIVSATDHADRVLAYTYEHGRLSTVSSEDYPTLAYGYEGSAPNRLTSQSGGAAGHIAYTYDSDGRVTEAGSAEYRYEPGLTVYMDGAGNEWTYHLDEQRRVTRFVTPLGYETITLYNSDGRKERVTAPDGMVTAYTYDAYGRVLTESSPVRDRSYTYGDFGLVTSVSTELGTAIYTYDPRGNQLTSEEPGRPKVAHTYDSMGRILTQTVAGTWITSYAYESALAPAWPTAVTDPADRVENRTYDVRGNLTERVDAEGFTTSYSYDNADRVEERTNPDGGKTMYSYTTVGQLSGIKEPGGSAVAYTYHLDTGLVKTVTVSDGMSYTFGYDGAGRATSATDTDGNTATWSWDRDGRLGEQTDLRGVATTYTYDAAGRPLTVKGPTGLVTYERDEATGRVSAIKGPGKRAVTLGYDAAGRVNRVSDLTGTLTATLNDRGQPETVTDGQGRITRYEYDVRGFQTRVVHPDGRTLSGEFDALGRLSTTTSASGLVTQVNYLADHWVATTDSLGRTGRFQVDWRGRQTAIIDADGFQTDLEYDQAGRLRVVRQGEKVTEGFTYDSVGRILTRTDGNNQSSIYTYDGHGRLESITDRRGTVTTYAYDLTANTVTVMAPGLAPATLRFDDANRLTESLDPAGISTVRRFTPEGYVREVTRSGKSALTGKTATAAWSWAYDDAGRQTELTDPDGHKTAYKYNDRGLLSTVTNALLERTEYTYHANDRLWKVLTPSGSVTAFDYDDYGRLEQVTDKFEGTWSYTYDAADRVTEQVDPLGRVTSVAYTGRNLVERVTRPGNAVEQRVTSYTWDAGGRLTEYIDGLGGRHVYSYDGVGRLTAIAGPLDQNYSYTYDAEGNIESITDPMNRKTQFRYDGGNRVTSRIAGDGWETEFDYDVLGRLTTVTAGSIISRLSYDGLGRTETLTDPLGRATTMAYSPGGALLSQTDALGNSSTFVYDGLKRVLSEKDRLGKETVYTYDTARGLVTRQDREGYTWTYQYDAAQRLVSSTDPLQRVNRYAYRPGTDLLAQVTDPMGNTRTYSYDAAGNLERVTDREGEQARTEASRLDPEGPDLVDHSERVRLFSYDKIGRLISETDPAGLKTTYAYDALSRRTSVSWPAPEPGQVGEESWIYYPDNRVKSYTSAAGGLTQYEYNLAGQVEKVTDPAGFTTALGYDRRGLVTSRTDSSGTTTFEYDKAGNLTALIDPRPERYRTAYTYDELNRLVGVVDPEAGAEAYAYDAEGRLVTRTDALGKVWTFQYDNLGRTTGVKDPLGSETTWGYTPTGKVDHVTDALGRKVVMTYDQLDRLIHQELPGGINQSFAYDWRSNLVARKDGEEHLTRFAFDMADRLTGVVDPLGNTTAYTYDVRGALTQVMDANGNATVYRRDALGRDVAMIDPEGNETVYTYDKAGRLASSTDPLNQTTTYSYNQRGQITAIDYAGEQTATFTYDAVGNLTRATNQSADQSFGYDGVNRLVRMTDQSTALTTSFTYDKAGNRTGIIDPEGRTTGYRYDDAGWLNQVTLPEGQSVNYTRDALHRVTGIDRPNSVGTSITYNPAGQIETLVHQGPDRLINQYSYEYDRNGNVTKQTEADQSVTAWTYDPLNRLTAVTYPKAKIEQIREQNLALPERIRPTKEGEEGDPGEPPVAETVSVLKPKAPWAKGGEPGKPEKPVKVEPTPAPAPESKPEPKPDPKQEPKPEKEPGSNGNSNNNGNNGSNGEKGDPDKGNPDKGDPDKGKGPDKEKKCKPQPQSGKKKEPNSGWKSVLEKPDYLLSPVSSVTYIYDKVGNRLVETRDGLATSYVYDRANRLTSAGYVSYSYDKAGNLTSKTAGDETTTFAYNAANKLTLVTLADETSVEYAYDVFGRKVRRTESAWVAQGNPHGTPPGLTDAKGKGNNEDFTAPGKGQGNEQTKANGKAKDEEDCPPEDGEVAQEEEPTKGKQKPEAAKKLKLSTETTSYVYDGLSLNLLKEYKGSSAALAEYYYANGQILGRKMFGLKGSILPDREPGLANGGTYYYLTDALGSVTDLTDHKGAVARQYRYDAFGGLFTGEVGPYNTIGLTGKSYDAKTGLMDYGARWYDPSVGRFTQPDPLLGTPTQPASQHRYAYVGNNPLNLTDPTGLSCTSPQADDLGIIFTWQCTNITVTGQEQRSDGIYDVGYSVTTYHKQGCMKTWDGKDWCGEESVTTGPQVPWSRWAAPLPDPGDDGGDSGGGNPGGGDGGGDPGGGGNDDDDDDYEEPPPDPRIEQERQRQYAENVMTQASGQAPSTAYGDYDPYGGYDTTATEGFGYSYSSGYSSSSAYGYYDPYGGYDTSATEGLYGYVPQPEKTWWDKTKDWYQDVSQTRAFKQTVAVVETIGGVAEAAAGAALCTTGVGCVIGGAMMVDGAAHFGSGVLDFGSITFGDGSSYGQNNVLRNAAVAISPEYGSDAYDWASAGLGLAGGYTAARQSMKLLETGESLLGSADVIAGNRSTIPSSAKPQVLQNQDTGMEFDNYVRGTKLRGVEEAGLLKTQQRLPTPEINGSYVQPDYEIWNTRGTIAAFADAKTSPYIPFDDQARGLLEWTAATAESRTLIYYTPTGNSTISPALLDRAGRLGVDVLQIGVE